MNKQYMKMYKNGKEFYLMVQNSTMTIARKGDNISTIQKTEVI